QRALRRHPHPLPTRRSSDLDDVSRSSLQKADALVYRSGGAGHIFIYEKGDGWNSMFAYECKGCSAGCIGGYRTASSSYKGIRRRSEEHTSELQSRENLVCRL